MIEKTIDIKTPDASPIGGGMTTLIFHPEDDPSPVIILYMDAFGIREELRNMARRLASVGYYVAVPNLYYRSSLLEVDQIASMPDEDGAPKIMPLVREVTVPRVMADSDALLGFIDQDSAAAKGPIGTVGYCMSGRNAIALAARHPDRVAAVASIYGTWLFEDSPTSPANMLPSVRCALYMACAEHDPFVPLHEVEALRNMLMTRDAPTEVELYAGEHHGFAFPQRASYSRVAAERHWEQLFRLFRPLLATA
ncbi:hypothetical protein CAF53_25285 (plasmid) [Sphingobium sp. LB126]|nr:hypothetical protein CAF53_26130 [Sphingobium sp. LB126]PJG45124.1 hypothetical protein CAF53_25285 [Sphingobium sp. LB126]